MLRGNQHKIRYRTYEACHIIQPLMHWISVTVPLVLGHTTNFNQRTDG